MEFRSHGMICVRRPAQSPLVGPIRSWPHMPVRGTGGRPRGIVPCDINTRFLQLLVVCPPRPGISNPKPARISYALLQTYFLTPLNFRTTTQASQAKGSPFNIRSPGRPGLVHRPLRYSDTPVPAVAFPSRAHLNSPSEAKQAPSRGDIVPSTSDGHPCNT